MGDGQCKSDGELATTSATAPWPRLDPERWRPLPRRVENTVQAKENNQEMER